LPKAPQYNKLKEADAKPISFLAIISRLEHGCALS